MAEFLLELLCEEIPARMQARAANDLLAAFDAALGEGIAYDKTASRAYVTPRRLTLYIVGLPAERPAKNEEKKGPRVGSPDQAIQGFLKSAGLAKIEDAEIRKSDKGDFYFATIKQAAMPLAQILPDAVKKIIAGFEWPKSMRWEGSSKSWVRPLRGITVMFDGKPLNGEVDFGNGVLVKFGNYTQAHRFMAANGNISVKNFADYQKQLKDGKVILDREERKKIILTQIEQKAAALGLQLRPDEGLLEEVCGLVEWPVVLIGTIDAQFMSVPDRVLITSMRQHQKYFALLNADGTLANKFAVVANIEAMDGGKTIIAGNERVLRARLHDAKFFFEQDQKIPLEDRLPKLKDIVFHAKLGTIGQKVERLVDLTKLIAHKIDANAIHAFDAATLCKADLTTGMVGEFPELQGYMGGEYARIEGEEAEVVDAIANHYRPLGPNDDIPKQPVAAALSLADKIDSLVGFFMVGEKPTGSKDPFALRRAALGIIRIIIENEFHIPLRPIIGRAYQNYADQMFEVSIDEQKLSAEVLEFFQDRLKVYLKDAGIKHDVIASVLSVNQDSDLFRILSQSQSVQKFLETEAGAQLLASYRRCANIVKAEAGKDKKDYGSAPDSRVLQQDAEIKVYEAMQKTIAPATRLIEVGKFNEAMQTMALLRQPLDAFFEQVMVNTPDAEVRANRLRLLNQIRATLDMIADFSKIEG